MITASVSWVSLTMGPEQGRRSNCSTAPGFDCVTLRRQQGVVRQRPKFPSHRFSSCQGRVINIGHRVAAVLLAAKLPSIVRVAPLFAHGVLLVSTGAGPASSTLLRTAAVDQQELWTTHENAGSRHKPWRRFISAESGSEELSRNRSTSTLSPLYRGQWRLKFHKREPKVRILTTRMSIGNPLNRVPGS